MTRIPDHKKLILFDGVCNLCNSSVNYIIRKDKANRFLFAPLQSDIASELSQQYNLDLEKLDSVILYEPGKGFKDKSSAALKIASHLGFPVNLLVIFYILPTVLRNVVYDFIAKNRYKWFGKKDACMIPTPELKAKFLE